MEEKMTQQHKKMFNSLVSFIIKINIFWGFITSMKWNKEYEEN
jgi:hypothetical protein